MHIYLSNAELEAIDDWRFANRVATRAEAIRRLCQMALVLDSRLTPIFEATKSYAEQNAELMHHMATGLSGKSHLRNEDLDKAILDTQAVALKAALAWNKLQLTIRDVTAKAYALKDQGKIDVVIGDVSVIDKQFLDFISRNDKTAEQLRLAIEELGEISDTPDETAPE